MSRTDSNNGCGRDIVVIGASAGGVQVLQELMKGLPKDLKAAVFVVVHTSPSSPGILPQILERSGHLPARQARNGDRVEHGRVYVAPPDFHMLLEQGEVRVTRGPKENGFRPAVDVLFRTAARAFGPRVVGIVLTGGMDDGTVGLIHIKSEGGVAIAQDPAEAVFQSMPQSAIDNANVDYVVPVAKMPELIIRLAAERVSQGAVMSKGDNGKPDAAEAGKANLLKREQLGPPTTTTCPECGGSLWEKMDSHVVRYECHVGHSYTAESLVAEKDGELESILWTALRALEENADLRRRMARRAAKGPTAMNFMVQRYEKQAKDAEEKAAVLREVLTNGGNVPKMARETTAEKKAVRSRNQAVSRPGNGSRTTQRRKASR